jgi:hypothetical protein
MNDHEIKEKRKELEASHKFVMQEWQEYDEQYPVIPGAYKPSDYHERQKEFHRRQSEISNAIHDLPPTRLEKLRIGVIWIGAIMLSGIVVWHFFF